MQPRRQRRKQPQTRNSSRLPVLTLVASAVQVNVSPSCEISSANKNPWILAGKNSRPADVEFYSLKTCLVGLEDR